MKGLTKETAEALKFTAQSRGSAAYLNTKGNLEIRRLT
jgi:hypothetical protein